jgi:hypothetical protein
VDTIISNVDLLETNKQPLITTTSDISLHSLHVFGDFIVDGSFNINNIIQNDITINNEILISTQLDISNQGTGPALKVSQFGTGDHQHVALFNAGNEGDSLLIDSSGNTTIYKNLMVNGDTSMNVVSIQTLDVSGLTILHDVSINGTIFYSSTIGSATIDSNSDISVNSLYVENNTTISGDIYLNGQLFDTNGDLYIGSGIFSSNDNVNYYTQKNVNIGTTDICSNFTLNVDGGVRIFSDNSSDEYYIPSNDWIPDLSNNIYYINGKVGIGTGLLNDDSKLYVNGKITINSLTTSSALIDERATGSMYLSHKDKDQTYNYALRQLSSGAVSLNSVANTNLELKINNVNIATIDADGLTATSVKHSDDFCRFYASVNNDLTSAQTSYTAVFNTNPLSSTKITKNFANNRFTINTAGYYKITANMMYENTTYNNRVVYRGQIFINGNDSMQYGDSFVYVRDGRYGDYGSAIVTTIVNLAVNDYAEIYVTLKKSTTGFGVEMSGTRVRLRSGVDFEYLGT